VTVRQPPLLAAGALCWRRQGRTVQILLVHRADRADISLPKGKVDPGETLPQTAVREVAEETGLAIALGAPLGTVEYVLPGGRDKVVHYWAAEVSEAATSASTFKANNEIAAVEWMPLARARKKLSYAHDRGVIDRFDARLKLGLERTFAIIALRHAKAVPPVNWDGPDSTRPLLQRGSDQALNIAPGIAAFGPLKIVSSTAARCLATVTPLSGYVAKPVSATDAISQDAHEAGFTRVASVVEKRIAKARTAVLCSHGPVLPEIIDEIARQTGTKVTNVLRKAAMLSTGEFSVFHLSVEKPLAGIVAVETHGPAIA
jgi:8-oxo-(d)GTP phosphatase